MDLLLSKGFLSPVSPVCDPSLNRVPDSRLARGTANGHCCVQYITPISLSPGTQTIGVHCHGATKSDGTAGAMDGLCCLWRAPVHCRRDQIDVKSAGTDGRFSLDRVPYAPISSGPIHTISLALLPELSRVWDELVVCMNDAWS